MYFLLRIENGTRKIVCHAEKSQHKPIMTANYCKINNIRLFDDRQAITHKLKDKSLCAYKIELNKYIILDCTYYGPTIVYNEYVNKVDIGYLEYVYYKAPVYTPDVLPLLKLKENLNNNDLIQDIDESLSNFEDRYKC